MSLTRSLKLSTSFTMLLLASCDSGTVTMSIPSPDGKLAAHVVQFDGGGATVATGFQVLVGTRDESLDLRELGSPVWSSNGVPVRYLFWRDDQTLEVVIHREHRDPIQNIRLHPTEGVTVVTTVLDGTSKRKVFEAVPIEVQSESAKPGS